MGGTPVREEGHTQDTCLTAVHRNFYLRFSEWIDAERAATTLRGRGYDASVRLGDDGNWLVLASKAIRLNGEYDGYERGIKL